MIRHRTVSARPALVAAALVAAVPALLLRAALADPAGAGTPVADTIRPGQEERVADMLRGANLPAGCAYRGAKLERDQILAAYTCGAKRYEVQLVHVARQDGPIRRTTSRFQLLAADAIPGDLVEAVARGVAEREENFAWDPPSVERAGQVPPQATPETPVAGSAPTAPAAATATTAEAEVGPEAAAVAVADVSDPPSDGRSRQLAVLLLALAAAVAWAVRRYRARAGHDVDNTSEPASQHA